MSDNLTPLQLIAQGVPDGNISDKTRLRIIAGSAVGVSNDTVHWFGVTDIDLIRQLNAMDAAEVMDLAAAGDLIGVPGGYKVNINRFRKPPRRAPTKGAE
jgi:hypothetical protein